MMSVVVSARGDRGMATAVVLTFWLSDRVFNGSIFDTVTSRDVRVSFAARRWLLATL